MHLSVIKSELGQDYLQHQVTAGSTETGADVRSDILEDLETSISEARKVAATCCLFRLNPEQLQHLLSKYSSYWHYYDIGG